MKYLLPCSCGKKVPVEPRQAGQVLQCSCGASFEVPTMLKLAALEKAPSGPDFARPRAAWGFQQKIVLLGVVVLVAASAPALYLFLHRPSPVVVDAEAIRGWVEGFSPRQTRRLWQVLRDGGIAAGTPSGAAAHEESLFRYHLGMGLLMCCAACGIGLVVAGLLTKRGPRRANRQ